MTISKVRGNIERVQPVGPAQGLCYPHHVPLVRVRTDATIPVKAAKAQAGRKEQQS
jgi:hypothetical protein